MREGLLKDLQKALINDLAASSGQLEGLRNAAKATNVALRRSANKQHVAKKLVQNEWDEICAQFVYLNDDQLREMVAPGGTSYKGMMSQEVVDATNEDDEDDDDEED